MEKRRQLNLISIIICTCLFASLANAQEFGSGEGEQKFQGFNLEGYSDEGEKAWDVKGETADILGSEIKITDVTANSYGEQKMNVTAETGFINQESGEMRLEKDVVITGETGEKLMTDSIDWNRDADLVTTEDEVIIKGEGMTVTGKGMEAKPGLQNAKIQEDVIVRVDTEPKENPGKKFVNVTSDGPMVIDQAQSKATFEDNVVAVYDGQTLKADKMELYFNEDEQSINEIICLGNVEITQGENQTFAEKAIYKAKEQRVILLGRPKLIMLTEGDNAITALGN